MNLFNEIGKQISKDISSLSGGKSATRRKKTVRKPTKAQMKKYVYPMINKAKKRSYAAGKKSKYNYTPRKRVVVIRKRY